MNLRKTLLISIGLIFLGAMAYFSYYFQQGDAKLIPTERELAEQRAFQWGQWLIQNKYEFKIYKESSSPQPSSAESANRGLASTEVTVETQKKLSGEIGRDPWGKPFQFHVQGDGTSGSTIFIWSLGENGAQEYSQKEDILAKGATGDDILIKVAVP